MSRTVSTRFKETGTRFLIHPQPRFLKGFRKPAVVYINAPPGTIKPGPRDDRMYVVDAVRKEPYAETGGRPPYKGPHRSAVWPSAAGHFDRLRPGTRAFSAAAIFATVRCVLEIWEHYFGRRLEWDFRETYPLLELIPRVESDNAWSKYGYIECGFEDFWTRRSKAFCENFDAVAHETGHAIVHSVTGIPPEPRPLQYRALDEALADLIAIVSSLHFDLVVNRLLRRTKGNLFSSNLISRVAELSQAQHIRNAFNDQKMSTVKWNPDADDYKYTLAAPFTGGAFDVLVEIYQHQLIRRGVIPRKLGDRAYTAARRELAAVQREFAREYRRRSKVFKEALLDARDYFGRLLARMLGRTSMRDPSYVGAVANMIEADAELSGGAYRGIIRASFEWRKVLESA